MALIKRTTKRKLILGEISGKHSTFTAHCPLYSLPRLSLMIGKNGTHQVEVYDTLLHKLQQVNTASATLLFPITSLYRVSTMYGTCFYCINNTRVSQSIVCKCCGPLVKLEKHFPQKNEGAGDATYKFQIE